MVNPQNRNTCCWHLTRQFKMPAPSVYDPTHWHALWTAWFLHPRVHAAVGLLLNCPLGTYSSATAAPFAVVTVVLATSVPLCYHATLTAPPSPACVDAAVHSAASPTHCQPGATACQQAVHPAAAKGLARRPRRSKPCRRSCSQG
jgi:hypothetical protein